MTVLPAQGLGRERSGPAQLAKICYVAQNTPVYAGPTVAVQSYRQRLAYQPSSRFWPLQLIETGFFLALSALLTWFCLRRLCHLS